MATKEVNQLETERLTPGDNDLLPIDVPLGGGVYDLQKIKRSNLINPAFTPAVAKVYKSGTQYIISGQGAAITGWTVGYDSHSAWDAGNNRYSIPKNGVYQFTINGLINEHRNVQIRLAASIDGTVVWLAVQNFTSIDIGVQRFFVSGEDEFSTGDYVWAYLHCDDSNSVTIIPSLNYTYNQFTWFSMKMLRDGAV